MSQPLIIEKNSIVELSRYTSSDKKSNSEWTNKLVTPLTVNEGDNILIKQCFIQNKLIDDNSIEIERDMSVKFQFVYYMIAHGINQYVVNYDNGEFKVYSLDVLNYRINGLPYMLVNQCLSDYPLYNSLYGRPVIEEFTINIKGGTIYEKPTLADEITRQMQSVNTKTQNVFIPNNNLMTCGTIVPFYNNANPQNPIFRNFSVPQAPSNPDKIVTTLQKQLYFINTLGAQGLPFDGSLFYLDNNNQPVFCKLVPMVNPDEVNYYELYNEDINRMLVPFMLMDGDAPVPMGTYSFIHNNTTYTGNVYDAGFIGCSDPALLFNDNQGNQKYSFQIHSSIIQGGNQVVGIYTLSTQPAIPPIDYPNINDTIISYLSSYSGIMFVNIYENYNNNYGQEVELLTLLGFTLKDLIPVDDIPNVFAYNNNLILPEITDQFYFQYNNYLQYTTRQFFPLGALSTNFQAKSIKIVPPGSSASDYTMTLPSSIFLGVGNGQTDGYNFSQSDNSTSIIASNFPSISQSNSGHWLIEISGWVSDYVNESKLMMVKAIVGNYLYGNTFSQTLGPDSLIYTHSGLPLTLTGISIRILSPITKQPPSDYLMGANSSVYLQVVNHHSINEPQPIKK